MSQSGLKTVSPGGVGFRIVEDIKRPSPGLVDRLRGFATTEVTDAMNRFGAMDPEIKPIVQGVNLVGPALTVRSRINDNLMVIKALSMARKGDVIVVEYGGPNRSFTSWGGNISQKAQQSGIAGAIIDGPVRDVRVIQELNFPIFARGVSPLGSQGRDGPGEINVHIQCGGVPVNPGDVIVGDDDGVAVIPLEAANEVAAAAAEVKKRDERLMNMTVAEYFDFVNVDKTLKEKGVI